MVQKKLHCYRTGNLHENNRNKIFNYFWVHHYFFRGWGWWKNLVFSPWYSCLFSPENYNFNLILKYLLTSVCLSIILSFNSWENLCTRHLNENIFVILLMWFYLYVIYLSIINVLGRICCPEMLSDYFLIKQLCLVGNLEKKK